MTGVPIERTKVVLAMWIVGGAEIVKSRDGLNQPLDGVRSEGGNAGRHHRAAAKEVLAKFVVKHAYAIRV
jgi:hypothetical protein